MSCHAKVVGLRGLRQAGADPRADRAWKRVNLLGGHLCLRGGVVAGVDEAVDAPGQRGDVSDAGDPLVKVAVDGLAGEPNLDGAVAERCEGG